MVSSTAQHGLNTWRTVPYKQAAMLIGNQRKREEIESERNRKREGKETHKKRERGRERELHTYPAVHDEIGRASCRERV